MSSQDGRKLRGSVMANHMKIAVYQPGCSHLWGLPLEKHAAVPCLRAPVHPSVLPVPDNTGRRAGPCPAQGIPGWEKDHHPTLQMHKAGGVGSVRRHTALPLQSRPKRAVRDLCGWLGYAKLCFPCYFCCLEGGRSPHSKHGADHDSQACLEVR